MTVDVVIPSYKPTRQFFTLIAKLKRQSCKVNKIIIMNTEEKYYETLCNGTNFLGENKDLDVHHLSRREFDHGRTRNAGAARSDADYVVFMTQDAIPKTENLIANLIGVLEQDDEIAVAYARQLPNEQATTAEKITRAFNYPNKSEVKSIEDLERLGIKTFFCSNVCAAYRMSIFRKENGFINHAIFNEDMIYAATVLKAGYKIAYVAEACVIHSHNYSNKQQFRRNFDIGVSQADHPEIFANVSSKSEGKRLVKRVIAQMKCQNEQKQIVPFIINSGCKYAGYLLGKNYKRFPRDWVIKQSMNQYYWK